MTLPGSSTDNTPDTPEVELGADGKNPVSPDNPPPKSLPAELRAERLKLGSEKADEQDKEPPATTQDTEQTQKKTQAPAKQAK